MKSNEKGMLFPNVFTLWIPWIEEFKVSLVTCLGTIFFETPADINDITENEENLYFKSIKSFLNQKRSM